MEHSGNEHSDGNVRRRPRDIPTKGTVRVMERGQCLEKDRRRFRWKSSAD